MISFLVVKGFALAELRKLYFDELIEFYKQSVRVLENQGEFKEGTFDKLTGRAGDPRAVVDQLRKGIAKVRQKSQ